MWKVKSWNQQEIWQLNLTTIWRRFVKTTNDSRLGTCLFTNLFHDSSAVFFWLFSWTKRLVKSFHSIMMIYLITFIFVKRLKFHLVIFFLAYIEWLVTKSKIIKQLETETHVDKKHISFFKQTLCWWIMCKLPYSKNQGLVYD